LKLYILIIAILFSGCEVHHHSNPDIIIRDKSVHADVEWDHNSAIIIIHHRHYLSRKEKRMLKRKYVNHFAIGKKRVKFSFVRIYKNELIEKNIYHINDF
jgi:hypothetical protein